MTALYISVDVETTGPAPGVHSMVQLGAVAILVEDDGSARAVDEFSVNLAELDGATQHPDTMRWWSTLPDVWQAHRQNQEQPDRAMRAYDRWVRPIATTHLGRDFEDRGVYPRFVAWPACFDWMHVAWYLARFGIANPHGYSALCMRSMLNGMCGWDGVRSNGDPTPVWMNTPPLEYRPWQHDAMADARVQGAQFIRMLHHQRGRVL